MDEPSLALDAVDAKHEIEQGADDGRQPDDADPAERGARIALGEHDVSRGRNHDNAVDGRDYPRPDCREEPLEVVEHAGSSVVSCQLSSVFRRRSLPARRWLFDELA